MGISVKHALTLTNAATPYSGGMTSGILWNNAGVLAAGAATLVGGTALSGLVTADVGPAANRTGSLYVADNTSSASLYMDGAGGVRSAIYLRSAGGTQAARTASPNNSTVGNVECFPYTPTGGYWPGSSIDFVIDGNVTDGQAPPTRIDFFVNPSNGVTGIAARIASDKSAQFFGSVGFSTTNTLDIGTSATVLAPRTVYAGTSFVGPIVTATTRVTTPAMGNSAAGGTYLQAQGSVNYFAIDNWVSGGSLTARATGLFGWMPGADPDATGPDTGLARNIAGTVEANTGALGSFGFMKAKLQTSVNATTGLAAGVLAALTNATIVVYDGSGQAYRVPCII